MAEQIQTGFSKFSWALALFCLPSALFPLALILSPQFSNHPTLTDAQIDFFSVTFWVYPAVLLGIAGVLSSLHRSQPKLAKILLIVAFVAFYALMGYIISFLGD